MKLQPFTSCCPANRADIPRHHLLGASSASLGSPAFLGSQSCQLLAVARLLDLASSVQVFSSTIVFLAHRHRFCVPPAFPIDFSSDVHVLRSGCRPTLRR